MRARAAAYPLWKRGNEMDQTIAFLGGDARMRLLAQMMAVEGYDVCSWELSGAPKPLALCDALKAEIIVLPLPAEKNGYLSGTELTMERLLRVLRPEHRIFAGSISKDSSALARALGLNMTDYFTAEELSVRNAIPTAEGAIELAMKHTSVTLHGTPCLVLGFGRIGKLLAHDLSALGARVTVSARKLSDLAWIDAFGYAPLHTNRLSGTLGEFRVVFNTVPHSVLNETLLAELPPDCLLIELASVSGFDHRCGGKAAPFLSARAGTAGHRRAGNGGAGHQKDIMSTNRGGYMKIGFAFCGSFCNHPELLKLYEDIAREHELVPILSENAAKYSTRFGTAEDFVTRVEAHCGAHVPCGISWKPSPSARRERWKCSSSRPARETRLPSSPTASRTAR